MRHLIISDVHGNLFGLQHALRIAREESIESLWCLGDLVGYNAYPNECVAVIRERGIPTVKGNHDALLLKEIGGFSRIAEWAQHTLKVTRQLLKPELIPFLQELPFLLPMGEGQLVLHANFFDLKQTINSVEKARQQFQEMVARKLSVVFLGHTHRPEMFVADKNGKPIARVTDWQQLSFFSLDAQHRYLVNPGTVGEARHGLPLSVVIYDDAQRSITYRHIELTAAEAAELAAHNSRVFGGVTLRRIPAIVRERLRKWYYQLMP